LENEVWTKIADILGNPNKLSEVIKESLEILRGRQAELYLTIKLIDEKLDQVADKKAKLADEWVMSNMAPSLICHHVGQEKTMKRMAVNPLTSLKTEVKLR
jgi:hypothetical protein